MIDYSTGSMILTLFFEQRVEGYTVNKCFKKLLFIHTVNGEGSKAAKNHLKAMLTTPT